MSLDYKHFPLTHAYRITPPCHKDMDDSCWLLVTMLNRCCLLPLVSAFEGVEQASVGCRKETPTGIYESYIYWRKPEYIDKLSLWGTLNLNEYPMFQVKYITRVAQQRLICSTLALVQNQNTIFSHNKLKVSNVKKSTADWEIKTNYPEGCFKWMAKYLVYLFILP